MFHVPAHKVPANDPYQPGQIKNYERACYACGGSGFHEWVSEFGGQDDGSYGSVCGNCKGDGYLKEAA